jgi:hypothetical protein
MPCVERKENENPIDECCARKRGTLDVLDKPVVEHARLIAVDDKQVLVIRPAFDFMRVVLLGNAVSQKPEQLAFGEGFPRKGVSCLCCADSGC